ncbi:pseudouridine synthase [Deefgea sp. CFH1-16]|uniref:pseudouridine synthase n=1 Tax=Deefgea sp. CFH1-16 TaxID=2675457 RepID=UPI0015F7067F|nr:pseudouridine synthase [Deefgea sp. CFH1-16]MBM5575275.1 pseudouridine synthase [Deefgea sp. CFH1-16]
MKTVKARRPQPAIREGRAADQQRSANKAGSRGKPAAQPLQTPFAKTGATKKKPVSASEAARNRAKNLPDTGRSSTPATGTRKRGNSTVGMSRMIAQAIAKTTGAREVQGIKTPIEAAETTQTTIVHHGDKSGKNVKRAKRMKQRQGSQQELAFQQILREKRLASTEIEDDRLQKVLAYSGLGSRRDMEEVIEAERVTIGGRIATLGCKVSPGDEVRIDGKRVALKWPDRMVRIIMYHKQEGELVSRDDPEGRVTVFDRLRRVYSSKWIAIGRLDFNTTGLLLFTTSGELANRMTHPSFQVEREYAVRVHGQLTPEQMKELTQGVKLDDGEAHFTRIEDRGGEGSNHWYHVVIKEGRNREVRRMFEHFNIMVSRLTRIRFGMFSLPGRLKRGEFYELSETEVLAATKWAGLTMMGQVKD